MSRLCIVSRDAPTLPGYLMVILDEEIKGPEGLDLIFDRRHGGASDKNGHGGRAERRQLPGIEEALRTRGFAIVGDEEQSTQPAGPRHRIRRPAIPTVLRVSRRAITTAALGLAVIASVAAATHAVLSIPAEERERLLARAAAWIQVGPDAAITPERGNAPVPAVPDQTATAAARSTSPTPDTRGAEKATAPAPTDPSPPSAPTTRADDSAGRSHGQPATATQNPASSSPSEAARGESAAGSRRAEDARQLPATPTEPTPRQAPPARASSTARSDSGARADSTAKTDSAARADSAVRTDATARPDSSARTDLAARPDLPARREALAQSEAPTLPPSRREPGRSPLAAAGRPDLRESSATSARREAAVGAANTSDAARRAAAAPSDASRARAMRAAGPPRVEFESHPEGADASRSITYTARLWDAGGRPIENARVTLHGWMPNGSDLETALGPATAGTYRGRATVGTATPGNLRLRVVYDGARFEIPAGR